MNVLIIYYSYTGNNELLARELGRRLAAPLHRIEERGRRWGISIFLDLVFRRRPAILQSHVQPELVEHVILVAPVWGGRIAGPMKTFLEQKAEKIRQYSFITLCGHMQNPDLESELEQVTGKKPLVITQLAVEELLPPAQHGKVMKVSRYRVREAELVAFERQLKDFMQAVVGAASLQT